MQKMHPRAATILRFAGVWLKVVAVVLMSARRTGRGVMRQRDQAIKVRSMCVRARAGVRVCGAGACVRLHAHKHVFVKFYSC